MVSPPVQGLRCSSCYQQTPRAAISPSSSSLQLGCFTGSHKAYHETFSDPEVKSILAVSPHSVSTLFLQEAVL